MISLFHKFKEINLIYSIIIHLISTFDLLTLAIHLKLKYDNIDESIYIECCNKCYEFIHKSQINLILE